jgi:WhiB family redox-sensing transcriptional regulator
MNRFNNYATDLLEQPQATPVELRRDKIPVSAPVETVSDPRTKGACLGLDPNIFHPEDEKERKVAIAICYGECAVRLECLEYALVNKEEYGIMGGVTENERRRMQKARKKVS